MDSDHAAYKVIAIKAIRAGNTRFTLVIAPTQQQWENISTLKAPILNEFDQSVDFKSFGSLDLQIHG